MSKNLIQLFFILAASSGGAAEQKLSLKQVVLYGIDHSPRIQGIQATRDNARLNLQNAEARFLPRLDTYATASMNYTTSPEFGSSGPNDNRTAGLTLSQSLWDGGIRSLARDAAKSRVEVADLDYVQSRDQLIIDIVRAFYDFSEASLAIQSHLEHQKLLEKQARDMESAFRQGMLIKRDTVRMRTELQRQELVVIAAKDQADAAKERLYTLMGASATNAKFDFDFQTLVPQEKSTDLSAVLVAEGSQLDIERTALASRHKFDEEAERFSLEAERRSKLWPTIDFNLGSSYRVNDNHVAHYPRTFSRDGVNWTASVGLKYTIWDWGIREREIATLVNDQKKSAAERGLARGELRQKIADIKRVLAQSEKNLRLNSELLKLEEESSATIFADFKQGRVSFLEVVDATKKLREAKLAHAKSYFDWQRKAWDFKYYAGGVFDVIQSL